MSCYGHVCNWVHVTWGLLYTPPSTSSTKGITLSLPRPEPLWHDGGKMASELNSSHRIQTAPWSLARAISIPVPVPFHQPNSCSELIRPYLLLILQISSSSQHLLISCTHKRRVLLFFNALLIQIAVQGNNSILTWNINHFYLFLVTVLYCREQFMFLYSVYIFNTLFFLLISSNR